MGAGLPVTAGNASGINDGAAAVVVMSEAEAERREAAKGLATLCIGGGMGIAMCVGRD